VRSKCPDYKNTKLCFASAIVNTKYLDAYENGFVYPSQARDRRDLVDLMGLLNWMPDVGMKSGTKSCRPSHPIETE
jgi:hypothetical protein